jgi:hypothetical protein
MAGPAPEAQAPAVLNLEQSAVTLGTAKSGRLTSGFVLGRREICQSGGHLYFRHHEVRDRDLEELRAALAAASQLIEQISQILTQSRSAWRMAGVSQERVSSY